MSCCCAWLNSEGLVRTPTLITSRSEVFVAWGLSNLQLISKVKAILWRLWGLAQLQVICVRSYCMGTGRQGGLWSVLRRGARRLGLQEAEATVLGILCHPISKVECDHRVHGEAVGTGETCNCISVHLPSTYLVFSFLDAHCNFCLFFYTGTVRDWIVGLISLWKSVLYLPLMLFFTVWFSLAKEMLVGLLFLFLIGG